VRHSDAIVQNFASEKKKILYQNSRKAIPFGYIVVLEEAVVMVKSSIG